MPLKLNVGVSKKVGLPEYSSVGAACHLEVELEAGLLGDPGALDERVRGAYGACRRAVDDELARLQSPHSSPGTHVNGKGHAGGRDGHDQARSARPAVAPARGGRPATPAQARALVAIARAQRADLAGLLRDHYGAERPDDLSVRQAGELVDRLKAAPAL